VRERSVAQLAADLGGGLRRGEGADRPVLGVATDSRDIAAGDAFVALRLADFDSHRFVADAATAGAACVVVEAKADVDGELPSEFAVIDVPDPLAALSLLATREREGLAGTFLGITGSTGKTCTKDFTAAALGATLSVAASPESFNNEIGLPLTILSVPPGTQAVVCEMGARGIGHIRSLCEVARPSIGIVTNVGPAHLELFGSLENIVIAKGELVEALPSDGTAVLNGDDPLVSDFDKRTAASVLRFGLERSADVSAEDVKVNGETGRAAFHLRTPWGAADVRLSVPGEQMVPDALAAAAAAGALGVEPEAAAAALGHAVMSGGRMQVVRTANGVTIVNDAYNANPTSMAAALTAASGMAGDGRWLAVLGEMAELGPIAVEEHARIGARLAALGVDELVAVGTWGAAIGAAAVRAGIPAGRVHPAADPAEAERVTRALMRPGDVVLVKASRVVGLRKVGEALSRAAGVMQGSGA
jgi:UDP-N-acetylmuramoyl-tripeptide--D-alanyl-D-alanine ligase